jgi:SAM-dependent methyltransferase
MSLADEYRRQRAWRDWVTAFGALPDLRGRLVLDLGCGPGDLAAELVARGARVIGVDGHEELLAAARANGLAGAEFRRHDLATLPDLGVVADGIWCSFATAYFTELTPVLAAWARHLRPGGWIALTEIDDMFGHEPVAARTRELLAGYAGDAFAARRYDFRMGRKLRGHLERAGFTVAAERTLADAELAFDGPAPPDVLAAWRARLERMTLLRAHCGAEWDAVREDILACLARPDHRATATVVFCLASLPALPTGSVTP